MSNPRTTPKIQYVLRFTDNEDRQRTDTFDTLDEACAATNACDDRGYRNVTVARTGRDSRIVLGRLAS